MYYISDNPVVYEDYIHNINVETAISLIKKIGRHGVIAIDTETNGMDYHQNKILLCSISNGEDVLVIARSHLHLLFGYVDTMQCEFIAHNAKFDFGMLHCDLGFTMYRVWDTMIADQKIYQGAGYRPLENPNGVRFTLTETVRRHIGLIPMFMDKDIRNQFIGVNPDTFVPTAEQVLYSGTDVQYLHKVKTRQLSEMKRMGIDRYMEYVGQFQPMAAGLIEAEGWILNKQQWRETIKRNEERKFRLAKELDNMVAVFRDTLLTDDERLYLTAGKYDRERKDASVTQLGLFDDTDKKVDASKTNAYINWNSTEQIADTFARLKFPLPTDAKRDNFAIPTLVETKTSKGEVKWVVDDLPMGAKFTTKKDQLATFLLENPNTPGKELLELLTEYRNADHEISSFGENFLKCINPVTGRIHTRYRTDTAETGRYQSGESGTMYPNFQNIPRKSEFRTAFGVDTSKYSVSTIDLSGAEVTIMCDKAHDMQLYEWAVKNDDAHSPIAQACWRNVFLYRAGERAGIWKDEKKFWREQSRPGVHTLLSEHFDPAVQKAYMLYRTFVVSKKENKPYRDGFKAVTFGSVYGMGVGKCARIMGISKTEAAIVLDTLKSTIPATFEYVEGCVDFVLNYGYLTLDERTGSRVLFPAVIDVLKRGETPSEVNLSWKVLHEIDGAARNYTIQGTQASMVKEALAEIQLWNKIHKFDAAVLNMVHDELNTRQPCAYDGINGDKTVLWLSDNAKEFLAPEQNIVMPVHTLMIPTKTVDALVDRQWAKNVSYPEFVRLTMTEAANRYLKHFKMGAELQVADTWVK